ncbi:hypothetical protein [Pedobacter punctiformis]|uniref:Uncharacterized protein n=1 Tax=Pedobacter punctiformis TaxID=3004097 RepID=A0ABT4L5F7_9SPHI|nr:hypothetical protein [Pedobacter sp. HCMS5-2]MCZ4242403.1 hypothetical protein [Pedobacter sp. HCMS5-2]
MAQQEKTAIYGEADSLDKKLMSIPPLNGYVLINGVLVNKNMGMQELRNRLAKIKNAEVFLMMNEPIIIFEPEKGHSFTEYDPKIDPTDDYIKLSFGCKRNKTSKEVIGIYYIDYFYSIKQ